MAELEKFGLGWMGWTSDVLDAFPLARLVTAREGRLEMLEAIFGKSDDKPVTRGAAARGRGEPIQLTPDLFDKTFGDAKRKRKKKLN